MKNTLQYCFIFLCFAFLGNSFATPKQNIHIQADHMRLNIKTKITTYTGNVLIKKPQVQLKGEKIVIKRNRDNQIVSIINHGNPAYYSDQSTKQKPIFAHAHIIEFYPKKHQAILKGKASIKQGVDVIHAPIVHYDTKNHVISAFGNKKTQIQMKVLMNNKKGI